MRKISWLPIGGCIAACVVQALVAADSTRTGAPKDPANSRSRLVIYSRNKDKVNPRNTESADAAGQASVSAVDADDEVPARSTLRTGNTGTVSPGKTNSKQVVPAAKPQIATRQAPAQADFEPTEEDAELLRKLFEEEHQEQRAAKQPAVGRQTATRPARAGSSVIQEIVTKDYTDPSDLPAPKSGSANRYQDLLESSNSPAPRSRVAVTQDKIQPVSRTTDDKLDLEVNPFEPSERPTKVVNAGFESNTGNKTPRRVQPVSASTTTRQTPAPQVQRAPVAKPGAPKAADLTKALPKPVVRATKPAPVVVLPVSHAAASQTPLVDVSWEARGEVTLGQECQCALIVNNSGKIPCHELVVEANLPESVRLVDASPFPQATSKKLEWHFANLAAGEKKTIELTIIPTKAGELAASAQVRFTGTAATSFRVSEPLLTATIKLPEEIRIGDPASATVTVSNPGTGTAHNIIVKSALPTGLECSSGHDFVSEIGSLGPGESRVIRLGLVATAGGDHTLKVVAQSSTSDLEQSAQAKVRVLAPSLNLTATGPSLRYLNRAAKYVLTATNSSNAASDNVRITQTLAAGFDFVKADHSGRWDAQRRTISWFIGHMEPGQSTAVELDVMPHEIGEFKHQFKVTGDAGVEATSIVTTRIEGAASLVMEVKDAEDPIEVGSDMVYAICVRNEGSKAAGKVAISCELPPDVELVSVDGPTPHMVESGMLIFKPVAEVAANDSITFKVTIKGTAPGTMKLRARLTSESIQKPLIVEEATQFYAE